MFNFCSCSFFDNTAAQTRLQRTDEITAVGLMCIPGQPAAGQGFGGEMLFAEISL